MEQGQIILSLGLYHSGEQGSRKFTWKQRPVEKFLRKNQVLIMPVCRKYLIAILIGDTIGGTNWNQVYGVIPTVKIFICTKQFFSAYLRLKSS